VALLSVIENIVQSYYNCMDDYWQSDAKYKAHVETHQKDQMVQKELEQAFLGQESKSSERIDLNSPSVSESGSPDHSEVLK
jgi:L-fucose mutarotase/ribose pyranase (RbsD/FucU family)